jgi:HAE1 family hydrophobic/amphiphilic exporter-1
MKKVMDILKNTEGITNYSVTPGTSMFDGVGPTLGLGFMSLAPWDERLQKGLGKDVIMAELIQKFSRIKEAVVFPFSRPPINGIGQSGGFELWLEDRAGIGLTNLNNVALSLVNEAVEDPRFQNVHMTFRAAAPSLYADIDRVKAMSLHIPLQSVFDTLQAYLGSTYVNDFNMFGRTWHVTVQAEGAFRAKPDDIKTLQVRNIKDEMAPLGTLLKLDYSVSPLRVDRYNMFPAIRILGDSAPGVSSGQALEGMEKLAEEFLPFGAGYEWTGMAYQEKAISGQIFIVFALAVLIVIMILAAQYESWIDPIAVVAIVPLAVLGAIIGLTIRGMDNNLYTQVGLVLLVGLSAKNAILIVEFARNKQAEGMPVLQAAIEGAKLRFRAILMTSFAFIVGVLPLVFAEGAGAASRQAVGTAVCAGMLGVTMLGVFFTPVMYVFMQRFKKDTAAGPAVPASDAAGSIDVRSS